VRHVVGEHPRVPTAQAGCPAGADRHHAFRRAHDSWITRGHSACTHRGFTGTALEVIVDTRDRERRDEEKKAIYAEGLRALLEAKAPFLVGGGFALYSYLGRWRTTKDVDIFIQADDLHSVLHVLMRAGFNCEITDAAWLAKARKAEACIDIIFC